MDEINAVIAKGWARMKVTLDTYVLVRLATQDAGRAGSSRNGDGIVSIPYDVMNFLHG